MVEGRIADTYWRHLQHVLPAKFQFSSRMHESHQMNASDPVNVLLNYGYAILESVSRKALFTSGLEPTVGFLHEARQTKYPLVYDLQEPYRWLVDTTVISCLESERFGKKDFYRMDNYVLRLRPDAVRKLIDALRIKFNSTVHYAGKLYSWDTMIRLKAQELASYILSNRAELSFEDPSPTLCRGDSERIRNSILSISSADARRLGIRKSTLWHLRHRAQAGKPMQIYGKVREKLEANPRSQTKDDGTGQAKGTSHVYLTRKEGENCVVLRREAATRFQNQSQKILTKKIPVTGGTSHRGRKVGSL